MGSCSSGFCQPITTPVSNSSYTLYDITADGSNVYWSDSSQKVYQMPIGGGTITTLASSQSTPYAIAIDTSNVYWVNQGNGTVEQVTKEASLRFG